MYKSVLCYKDFFVLQRVAKRITKIGSIYGAIAIKLLIQVSGTNALVVAKHFVATREQSAQKCAAFRVKMV